MKQHILSLSYGKDSLACLGAIEKLGWPLDRIVHSEVMATQDIPADLPPMVAFKKKADAIIKERWNIEVEHITSGKTFEGVFYQKRGERSQWPGDVYGWPNTSKRWCVDRLKTTILDKMPAIRYLGIASDEPERLEKLDGANRISPLAALNWTEADCLEWCRQNDLLSPIYQTGTRGGCWFCPLQSVDQLRRLRKDYPELWDLMLKWDLDSQSAFKPNGHTVHDYDRRFELEDAKLIPKDKRFRWKMIESE